MNIHNTDIIVERKYVAKSFRFGYAAWIPVYDYIKGKGGQNSIGEGVEQLSYELCFHHGFTASPHPPPQITATEDAIGLLLTYAFLEPGSWQVVKFGK